MDLFLGAYSLNLNVKLIQFVGSGGPSDVTVVAIALPSVLACLGCLICIICAIAKSKSCNCDRQHKASPEYTRSLLFGLCLV
jgi:hypothetical protein